MTTIKTVKNSKGGSAFHELKLLTDPYDLIESNIKFFDVRLDDRYYMVGDVLSFWEWLPNEYVEGEGEYTGRSMLRSVNCIQDGLGLLDGYVVLGINDNV